MKDRRLCLFSPTNSLLILFFIIFSANLAFSLQILKFQETPKKYTGSRDTYKLSDVSTGWTTSKKYGFSTWIKKLAWDSSIWETYIRVANDKELIFFSGKKDYAIIFHIGMTGSANGPWSDLEPGVEGEQLIPVGQWVFFALSTNTATSPQEQSGFRYTLPSFTTQVIKFKTRPPEGAFYDLKRSGTIFLGQDTTGSYDPCDCFLQYVRLYIDYYPNSVDEMINLATMDTGNLYLFYFNSVPSVNDNQTAVVKFWDQSAQGSSTAYKGLSPSDSVSDPTFGPDNTLQCRSDTIFTFGVGTVATDGLVIAMDIKPYSGGPSTQTIFSIRDITSNIVPFVVNLDDATGTVTVVRTNSDGSPVTVASSPAPLVKDSWNRLVIECTQAQPINITKAYYSTRIFVDTNYMINRVYFADSEAAINNTKLFLGVNTMVLDFCSQMQNGITPATRETTKDGNYDILNLMWFTGPGSLFQNQSDPRCAWSGVYLEPNQKSCVLCKTGFYWYKRACYVTCPSNTFLDSDSRSCQECQYGYYHDVNGVCMNCTNPQHYYLASNLTCMECHPTCLTCTSSSDTSCSSCDTGRFLLNHVCLTSCPHHFFENPINNTCDNCPMSIPNFLLTNEPSYTLLYCQKFQIQFNYSWLIRDVKWSVTSTTGNPTHESQVAAILNHQIATNVSDILTFTISPPALFVGAVYQITATVNNYCFPPQIYTITIDTSDFPTLQLNSPPAAAILQWWEYDGTLVGCTSCLDSSSPMCDNCVNSLLYNTTSLCICFPGEYVDMGHKTFPACKPKTPVQITLKDVDKVSNVHTPDSNYRFIVSFDEGFSQLPQNLEIIKDSIGVAILGPGSDPRVSSFTAQIQDQSILLSFIVADAVETRSYLTLTNLSHYNELRYSPFYLENLDVNSFIRPKPANYSANTTFAQTTQALAESAGKALSSSVSSLPWLLAQSSPLAILLSGFLGDIILYKFINVQFPANFDNFCEMFNSLNVFPNIFLYMRSDDEGSISTTGKFQRWEVDTTMLENAGDSVFQTLLILGCLAIFSIFAAILRGRFLLGRILTKLVGMMKWNIVVSNYLSSFCELWLYSLLQIKEQEGWSVYKSLSFSASIIVVTSYVTMLGRFFYLLNRNRWRQNSQKNPENVPFTKVKRQKRLQDTKTKTKPKPKPKPEPKLKKRDPQNFEVPKSLAIIHEEFVTTTFTSTNFMLLILLEKLLIITVVVFLQDHGSIQAALYTFVSLVYCAILVFFKPFKGKKESLIFFVSHCSQCLLGTAALAIGLDDERLLLSQQHRMNIGFFLIVVVCATMGLNALIGVVLSAVEIVRLIRGVIQKIKTKRNARRAKRINLTKSQDANQSASELTIQT